VHIFEAELRTSGVSSTANFFDIGATSVALNKIHARIRAQLGVELDLLDLYAAPTIVDLAKLVEARVGGS
jgi:aryl carrier-like protein